MIGIDLTKSEQEIIQSLEKWLHKVYTFTKTLLNNTNRNTNYAPKESQEQLIKYLKYIKLSKLQSNTNTVNRSISTVTDSDLADIDLDLKVNTGCPIIVIGCKSDTLTSTTQDINQMNSNKIIQGKIRAICLQFGAGLIYTSAEKAVNVSLLRKYIAHRLYPEALLMEMSIQVLEYTSKIILVFALSHYVYVYVYVYHRH